MFPSVVYTTFQVTTLKHMRAAYEELSVGYKKLLSASELFERDSAPPVVHVTPTKASAPVAQPVSKQAAPKAGMLSEEDDACVASTSPPLAAAAAAASSLVPHRPSSSKSSSGQNRGTIAAVVNQQNSASRAGVIALGDSGGSGDLTFLTNS
jgi:hypothetical protein